MKYYISYKLITDKSTTGYDLALKLYFDQLGTYLSGSFIDLKSCARNIYTNNHAKVRESIKKLIQNQYINATEIEKDEYQVGAPYKCEAPFLLIDSDKIIPIVSSSYTFKYSMLKHYCFVLANRFYNKSYKGTYVCARGLEYFAKEEDLSIRVLSKYNTILEKMGLLYIFKSQNPDQTNLYSLPEDKKFVINFAEYTKRRTESLNADKKRSLMQKYYQISNRKQECGYSKEEIAEVKAYIEVYNMVVKPESKRDMSVFDELL